jgi:hypothetical protein
VSLLAGVISGASAPVTSLSLGSATSSGSWINGAPSVTTSGLNGDLIVTIQMKRTNPTAISTPSGFTNFIQTSGSYFSVNASHKVASTTSETITFQNLNDTSAVVLRARPNRRIGNVTFNPGSYSYQEALNQSLSSTLTMNGLIYPVYAVAVGFGSNSTRNVLTIPNMNYGVYFDSVNSQNLVYYSPYNSSPGNISCSVQPDGNTVLFHFALTVG